MFIATRWLRRLTLGKKLLTAFGLLFFLLTLSLLAILFYLTRINSYVERHNRITIPAVITAGELRGHLYTAEAFIQRHVAGKVRETAAVRAAEMRRLVSVMRASLDLYQQVHAANMHPILHDMLVRHGQGTLATEEQAVLMDMSDRLRELADRWDAIVRSDPKQFSGFAPLLERAASHTRHLTGSVTHLMQLHARIDQEMKIEGDALLRRATFVILALVGLLGVMLGATYRIVTTEIIQPLRRLAATAARVARHDLGAEFEPWPARDEVGGLSRALQSMFATLRQRTRSLERKTQELEAFTSSVAHDLKAPLREIEGFAALLCRRPEKRERMPGEDSLATDPTTLHYLERIQAASLRMATLIDALLRYSRLEQQSLPKSRINVRQLIDEVVRPYTDQLEARTPGSITIELPFTDIHAEASSVRQALANLVDNAIKFSRGCQSPAITVGGCIAEGERILWVRDHGIGFDSKDSNRIFKLFERLAIPEEYEGTGVGLAIVKLVMEKHGGRVWVESSMGKGSTFYLAFPDEDIET